MDWRKIEKSLDARTVRKEEEDFPTKSDRAGQGGSEVVNLPANDSPGKVGEMEPH